MAVQVSGSHYSLGMMVLKWYMDFVWFRWIIWLRWARDRYQQRYVTWYFLLLLQSSGVTQRTHLRVFENNCRIMFNLAGSLRLVKWFGKYWNSIVNMAATNIMVSIDSVLNGSSISYLLYTLQVLSGPKYFGHCWNIGLILMETESLQSWAWSLLQRIGFLVTRLEVHRSSLPARGSLILFFK